MAEPESLYRQQKRKDVWGTRLRYKRQECKDKGIPFDLDVDYLRDLYRNQGGLCAVLGVPMDFYGEKSDLTASLDRIDPTSGYTRGNVAWITLGVNRLKNNNTDPDVFYSIGEYLERNQCVGS